MKKFSKILSVALLVALVLSLGVANAFAVTPADYSITVTNALKDETYSAYKMFDLVVDDPTNPTAYTYTVNSDWTGFTTNTAFTAAFTIENGYVKAKNGVNSESTWNAGSVMSTLAEAAAKYAADNDINPVKAVKATANGNVKLEVGEAGYYVISSTVGSRAMIQTTPAENAVTIVEKNEGDTIDKKVKEDSNGTYGTANDAQVGDTVEFKSEATIAARSINVKIHDTMDSGLTLNPTSIKVYTDEAHTQEYSDATVRAGTGTAGAPDTGDTFTIDIPDSFAATATGSQKLYFVYTAEINADAVVKDENGVTIVDQNNKTHVQYGDGTTSQEKTTTTTTHKFAVLKYAGEDSSKNLAGAVFQVLKNGTVVNLVKLDDHNYRVVDDTETGDAVSHANDGELNTIVANTIVSDFVTVGDDDIVIWGVDSDSDYSLREIQPPKGYNACADTSVTVNANNETRIKVQNNTGSVLPSTGGIGTTIFYVVGGVLVLAAIILLVTKKRMSE